MEDISAFSCSRGEVVANSNTAAFVADDSEMDMDDSASPQECQENLHLERDVLDALTGKENQAVSYLRFFVLGVLTLAAFAFSAVAYYSTRLDQLSDFHSRFEIYSQELIDSFHKAVEKKLEAVDTLSMSITSHALGSNSTFP